MRADFKKNLGFLSLIHFTNLVIPFLIFPYLFRVLGVESFGLYSLSAGIIIFFTLLSDFGTTNYASRKISIMISEGLNPRNFVIDILRLRFLLACAGGAILWFLCKAGLASFDNLDLQQALLINYLAVIAFALSPDWYFTGSQWNVSYAKVVFVVKSGLLVSIYTLVSSDAHVNVAILCGGISQLTISSVSLGLVFGHGPMSYQKGVSRTPLKKLVVSCRSVFFSRISIELYRGINPVVLGFISGYQAVGFYSAAERLVTAIQTLQFPLGRAVMPYATVIVNDVGLQRFILGISKYATALIVFYLCLSITVFLTAPFIVEFVFGSPDEHVILNTRTMSPILLFGCLNYMIFMAVILPSKSEDTFYKTVLLVVSLGLPILTILAQELQDFGSSLAITFSEALLCTMLLWSVRQRARGYDK